MKHILGPRSKSTLTNVMDGDSQPNAVDLRLKSVFKLEQKMFTIDEDQKIHRGSSPVELGPDGYWLLAPGSYEVVMENEIGVGDMEAGWVITRSTLNRNGVFITSGLYDTGYNGVMAGCMHITTGPMKIKPGTRVAQYLSFDAESLSKYDGSYGNNKDHDKKYN